MSTALKKRFALVMIRNAVVGAACLVAGVGLVVAIHLLPYVIGGKRK